MAPALTGIHGKFNPDQLSTLLKAPTAKMTAGRHAASEHPG